MKPQQRMADSLEAALAPGTPSPYVLCLAGLARARDENQPELEQTGTGHLSTVSVFYSGNWERERNSWK